MSSRPLSDAQVACLWGISAGSSGAGSNPRTLESLRKRGLIQGRESQGDWIWDTTPLGEAALGGAV